MAQQIEMMKKQMMMLGAMAEKAGAGEGIVASLAEQFGIEQGAVPSIGGGGSSMGSVNSLGVPTAGSKTLERAKKRARAAAGAK